MLNVGDVTKWLDEMYPPELAESWDNIGLLVGDPARTVERVMTCLSVSGPVVREAIANGVDLLVTHHPIPFRALKKLNTYDITGRYLWELIGAKVCIYSPHTSHDSASYGINWQLAERLGLQDTVPLVSVSLEHPELYEEHSPPSGKGRIGHFSEAILLSNVVTGIKEMLGLKNIQYVGDPSKPIRTVAIGCGAADEFLELAHDQGADALLLGEARFHTCLEAEALGLALIMPGHYASERFALEQMADNIRRAFSGIEARASIRESDPIKFA